MSGNTFHKMLTFFIATVWLVNGLLCKVMNLVPRHEKIVANIVNEDFSRPLTLLLGFSEIGMAIWIISSFKPRLSAAVQIAVVAVMNILEFVLVPDLLLWGRANAIFASFFIFLVYYYEFILNNKPASQT
jgi:hypothetical protein